jgi:hypothetical protein
MIKVTRRTAAAATAVIALGTGLAVSAAVSPTARATTTADTGVIPRCSPGQLAVWVKADDADATAGTTYYHLDYTNISGSTCHLYSWPGVSATSIGGEQLGVPAIRTGGVPATYVNIPPNGTAHSILGYVDIQVGPGCKPVAATYLKVYPPDDSSARHAFFALPVCTTKTPDLVVWRVQPGA